MSETIFKAPGFGVIDHETTLDAFPHKKNDAKELCDA
jgi:hypothetical protein